MLAERAARPRAEQHRRGHVFDVELDPDGPHVLEDQLLRLLPELVPGGGLDLETQPRAVFGVPRALGHPDAVGAGDPPGFLEEPFGLGGVVRTGRRRAPGPPEVQLVRADGGQAVEQLARDLPLVDAELDGLAHPGIAQDWMRVLPGHLGGRPIEGGIGHVEDQPLGFGPRRRTDPHSGDAAELGHVRFDQVPDDVHVAGPQQLLAHLPARHDPDDHPVEIGLLLDPVPLIPDQRDVIGRYPLDDLERAAAQGLPVVLPLRHGGWVAGGVTRQDPAKPAEGRGVIVLVPDDGGLGIGAVHRLDLVVSAGRDRSALWGDDRFPGELHIVAGQRPAVRPGEAGAQPVRDRLPVLRHPAVRRRRDFRGELREILPLLIRRHEPLDGQDGDLEGSGLGGKIGVEELRLLVQRYGHGPAPVRRLLRGGGKRRHDDRQRSQPHRPGSSQTTHHDPSLERHRPITSDARVTRR